MVVEDKLTELMHHRKDVSNEELLEAINLLHDEQQKTTFTDDEIKEIKSLIEDRRALSRTWQIGKAALLSIAGALVAYNVLFDNIKHFFMWFVNKIS